MRYGVGDSMVSWDEDRRMRTSMETTGALEFGNNIVNETSERIGRMKIVRSLKNRRKKTKSQLPRPLDNEKRD